MWKNHNNGDINIGKNRNYMENTTGIYEKNKDDRNI
jgi:hypothetical protein